MIKKFTVGDHGNNIKNMILEKVHTFSVPIFAVREFPTSEKVQYVGSGTLIKVDRTYGILTAGHVLKNSRLVDGLPWNLTDPQITKNIGIGLSLERHRFVFPAEHLRFFAHFNLEESPTGPDVGLIMLPSVGPKIEKLLAIKSFFPVDRVDYKNQCESISSFVGKCWVLVGFPGEWVLHADSDELEPTAIVNGLVGFCGMQEGIEEKNEFDIVRATAIYDSHYEGPRNFGGISGGGLWFCSLEEDSLGNLQPSDPILYGMPIYQNPIQTSERLINCHGMKVIYKWAACQLKSAGS